MTTFEDLLSEVGTFGRCQKRLFMLCSLISVPLAWVYVGIVFQGLTPDHWCRDSAVVEMRQACGWSLADSRRLTVPLVNSSGEVLYSSCEQFEVDWNATKLTCDTRELNLTGVPVTTCKDGWEYQYEGRSSIVTEFNLVCSDAWLVDMHQSVLNMGFFIGTFVSGYVSDRFGRRISLLMTNMINLTAGLVLALTPNYISSLAVKFIFGLGAKGGWLIGYVLITEMVGVEHRRTVGILYQMFFSIGILTLPLLSYFITDWRWLQAAIAAPYLLFISYYCLVPESPRWLISQKRFSKALEITEAMAKENKKELSVNIETLTSDEGDSPSASVLDLIRTPNMRKHTFILMFNWFASAVVYQGLVLRTGILESNVYVEFVISCLVEFPAVCYILFTIERFGRRLPFAVATITAGLSCLIMIVIPEKVFWLKTLVGCIGRMGITVTFLMVLFVNAELYPTFVRNLGVSVCSTMCDIGGIAVPFLLYRLAVVWIDFPLVIFGVIALIAGGLVLLLPETKGVPLPETIDDVEFPNRKKKNAEENQEMNELLNPGPAHKGTAECVNG
ncbi:solute carrier family 22 member 2-like [Brachionichthys hirsutus]|uniref:solute carrier family 22 member 2-like n=1 Tax=Brachionichthys hirsutus TaxID=412623 RepID=UPI003605097F